MSTFGFFEARHKNGKISKNFKSEIIKTMITSLVFPFPCHILKVCKYLFFKLFFCYLKIFIFNIS
jgi:hypothetical protein